MTTILPRVLVVMLVPVVAALALAARAEEPPEEAVLAGSRSCRECHERFYELWAPSHHGTAMQPFRPGVGLPETSTPLVLGEHSYGFVLEGDRGFVIEDAATRHEVAHVMGGKNVFFLLTPRERGRLQVLPIAYDVRAGEWYDTTASMVRHAAGHPDEPVVWTDSLLTFNTSCWSCHVSQLSVNYDLETDTYESRWAEPGINCETCHGPASEHVRVCREAEEGEVPDDLRIVRMKTMSPDTLNDACATCHAKAVPISDAFEPGERYFDHFDLVTLEDPDFHPDGRDLGENYTFTLWRMSPCVQQGELDCVHCHTSSGRYRFASENPNGACLPCHADHVEDAEAHTHHAPDGEGSLCISCHMPMTTFARMQRSDHSMRPPAPALTLEFGSPNACNLCHTDRDAAWADAKVREWRERDYQAPLVEQATLIAEARARDWRHLDAMLAAIAGEDRDEVVATSLIRLLAACPDPRKAPTLLRALDDPSPLVRSSAATALEPYVGVRDVAFGLVRRLRDDVRLVRVRAAGALAAWPTGSLPEPVQRAFDEALGELTAAWRSRPDQWYAHYNLGNLHDRRGELDAAIDAYETAIRLRPSAVMPRVNLAMVHARRGSFPRAEAGLREAIAVDPDSAEAHFNLGLLLVETGRRAEAREHLEASFRADETLARAAINLAVLCAEDDDLEGAVSWSREAVAADPLDPRAAWTHAHYLAQAKDVEGAIAVLERAVDAGVANRAVHELLTRLRAQR